MNRKSSRRLPLLAVLFCASVAWGQSAKIRPEIGYVYPAGGQRGSVCEIVVGGQFLKGVKRVHVSGEGVTGTIVENLGHFKRPQNDQREELRRQMAAVYQKRLAELPPDSFADLPFLKRRAGEKAAKLNAAANSDVQLPNHPLLHNLEDMTLHELEHVRHELERLRTRQRNAQLAESVILEITIEPDAAPGDRELRLGTPLGLTNPMCFQVGSAPEKRELEPNGPNEFSPLPDLSPFELPVVANGQIMPGDVDRFRFRAEQGRHLVIQACARRLVPYLADAVPGWFQAVLTLYDPEGNEVVFGDDYGFDPDPVLLYEVPRGGEYTIEIRDSIYRGREDFVYRIAVGEQPFITSLYPLGGRAGSKTLVSLEGWNLPVKRLRVDTERGGDAIREVALDQDDAFSNPVPYAVDVLPESNEAESNDTIAKAKRVRLPRLVNGRIGQPGDVDVFEFRGRKGEAIVAEVTARRVHSPLDSLVRLTDASGAVLAWNDDQEDAESGLLTHHADSYLCAALPEDGAYYVQITDSQGHGGETYAYRLRIGPPQPDFALRVTPSSLNMATGFAAPLRVHAMRRDGFSGDIEITVKDAPPGFEIAGGVIPAGRDSIRMTLTAPREPFREPVPLQLEGRATIDGEMVARPVVAAEDMMQAFLYRHLMPCKELVVTVNGRRRRGPRIEWAQAGAVQVAEGGATTVRLSTPDHPEVHEIQFELSEPIEGISLEKALHERGAVAFEVHADGKLAKAGRTDNLIVEAFIEPAAEGEDGKARKRPRRFSIGVLPALPFEVVPR